MTTLDVHQGDSILARVQATWGDTGATVDLTGAKLVSTARQLDTGTTAWTKKNTAAGGDDTQILVDTPATSGKLTVLATAAECLAMRVGAVYDCDVVAKLSDGTEATLAEFRIRITTRPTQTNIA